MSASPEKSTNLLAARVADLQGRLRQIDPEILAKKTGSVYRSSGAGHGAFSLEFWSKEISISYPDFSSIDASTQMALGVLQQALLMYYFVTADGFPHEERWISFTDLPDGRFYTQAFQGYSGKELAAVFGTDIPSFDAAAAILGGVRFPLGDASFSFKILPRASLLAVLWIGDEDFPTSAQILFNGSIAHYLPTDACAIAGSSLVRQLIQQKSKTRG